MSHPPTLTSCQDPAGRLLHTNAIEPAGDQHQSGHLSKKQQSRKGKRNETLLASVLLLLKLTALTLIIRWVLFDGWQTAVGPEAIRVRGACQHPQLLRHSLGKNCPEHGSPSPGNGHCDLMLPSCHDSYSCSCPSTLPCGNIGCVLESACGCRMGSSVSGPDQRTECYPSCVQLWDNISVVDELPLESRLSLKFLQMLLVFIYIYI